MLLLTSAGDDLRLLLCVGQEGCAGGGGVAEEGGQNPESQPASHLGMAANNTWHWSGHRCPEDETRALAEPGPKGKIFWVPFTHPVQPRTQTLGHLEPEQQSG